MRVLYIGGTGEISLACVGASVQHGHEVTVFNRGKRAESLPDSVTVVTGDLNDDTTYAHLADENFDAVCQFLAFKPETVARDIALFSDRCGQYVFISSASAYQKSNPPEVITERTPLENPHWAYSRSKAACEALLQDAQRLNTTIVRPSHTYRNRMPSTVIDGDHLAWRMLQGKPVIVHGDGASLWTLTHARDFAAAFVALLGRDEVDAVHITDSESHTWADILHTVARALDVQADIRPVPNRELIRHFPDLEGPLLGDKANSLVFDNTRIQSCVPGWQCSVSLDAGVAEAAQKFLRERRRDYAPDASLDAHIDRIITDAAL